LRYLRLLIGAGTWIALGALVWWCVDGRDDARSQQNRRAAEELWQFAAGERRSAALEFDRPTLVAVGDPIFVADDEQGLRQVGELRAVPSPTDGGQVRRARTGEAEALFYASAPQLSGDSRLVYHTTPDSMEWVLQTMLPPEKRTEIATELSRAFEDHHEEILAELMPIVEASLSEGFAVVEQDLAAAVLARRGEFESLGSKYQREIVERELVPLVQTEIWPIVRRHAEPEVTEIGKELWQRASLWRFGWRYLYDRSMSPERSLFQQEWNRYLKEEATPVLMSHTDELIETQKRILADVARNPRVQESVRRNLGRIIDDPELQQLVWEIIEEVIIDNPRLHDVLQRHWTSPQAQAAFRLAAERLEPSVERIARLIFGDEQHGLTPEFARVLRSQLLHKDRRWLVLETTAAPARTLSPQGGKLVLKVKRGEPGAPNPFVQSIE
jgi:hypothetical protein